MPRLPRACPSGPRSRRVPVGLLVGLQSSYHPLLAFPVYADTAALPVSEQARALRDPGFRARLLADMERADDAGSAGTGGAQRSRRRPIDYGRLYPLGDVPDYEPAPETSVLRLAASRGVDPAVLLLDLLSEHDGRDFLYTPFSNYADGNLDACGEMLAHPHTVFGLGDGGAHVGLISDASFPTYALSHWARDRAHGRMEVGQVVEQLTSATARAVGLARPGGHRPRHAGGHQRHRLRGAGVCAARHGLRPARRGQAAPARRRRLPRHHGGRGDHVPRR